MSRLFLIAILAALCLGVGLASFPSAAETSPNPVSPPSNETWKDQTSGLTWQVLPADGTMNWEAAKAHCASLHLGGSRAWRLPTITELRSLIRGCPATQKGGLCGVTDSCATSTSCWKDPCKGCANNAGPGPRGIYWPPELSGDVGWYWSSSAVANIAVNLAWFISFGDSSVGDMYVSNGNYVRCVRP